MNASRGYGWTITVFALLMLCISNGMTVSGINVYDEALLTEFGWNRADLKFRDLITLVMTGLLAPFVGMLLDKTGAKRIIIFGCLVLAAAYWQYSRVDSLAGIYIAHALFALALVSIGLNSAVILVSLWVEGKRGAALGIAIAGSSLGGVIFPQLGSALIAAYGWRQALLMEAVIPLLLCVVSWVLLRQRSVASDTKSVTTTTHSGLPYRQAIARPEFWLLALVAMCTYYSVLGAQAHLFLYLRDSGYSIEQATASLSLLFIAALAGKFLFGLLADMISQRILLLINIAIMLGGTALLASMNLFGVWLAVLCFGFGWGGLYTLIQLIAVNLFGLQSAGKILGTITILDASAGGLGIWLTGVLYHQNGNYSSAFRVFFILLCMALCAAWLLYRRERHVQTGYAVAGVD